MDTFFEIISIALAIIFGGALRLNPEIEKFIVNNIQVTVVIVLIILGVLLSFFWEYRKKIKKLKEELQSLKESQNRIKRKQYEKFSDYIMDFPNEVDCDYISKYLNMYQKEHPELLKYSEIVSQIRNKNLDIVGLDVKIQQSNLIKALEKKSVIWAVDVTANPSRLLDPSRNIYHDENKKFIKEKKGKIKRIFVLNDTVLFSEDSKNKSDYLEDFIKVLDLNDDIGVDYRIVFNKLIEDIKTRYDVIIYGTAAMVLEVRQLTAETELIDGNSRLFFDKKEVKEQLYRVEKLWEYIDKPGKKVNFLNCCIELPNGLKTFKCSEFIAYFDER